MDRSSLQNFGLHNLFELFVFPRIRIYTDSAEAKIPSILDYVGTVIEVLLCSTSLKRLKINTFKFQLLQHNLCYEGSLTC
ncbi:hypothetical protein RIF29_10117 [Crotalaria pallida]|uniref:Uncharacterized protein n=1 Tax=Crotalaria pallida TaxID=3830 RepID=A0AAN9FYQ1_CROPI